MVPTSMFIAFLFQKNLSYVDENIVELYQGKSILILRCLLVLRNANHLFLEQNLYRICFRGHSFKQKVAGNITNQLFTIISVLIFTMFCQPVMIAIWSISMEIPILFTPWVEQQTMILCLSRLLFINMAIFYKHCVYTVMRLVPSILNWPIILEDRLNIAEKWNGRISISLTCTYQTFHFLQHIIFFCMWVGFLSFFHQKKKSWMLLPIEGNILLRSHLTVMIWFSSEPNLGIKW